MARLCQATARRDAQEGSNRASSTRRARIPCLEERLDNDLSQYWYIGDDTGRGWPSSTAYMHQIRAKNTHSAGQVVYCQYWPSLFNDVRNDVRICDTCSHLPSLPRELLTEENRPTRPNESVATDLFSFTGFEWLLMVDRHSGWPFIDWRSRSADSSED